MYLLWHSNIVMFLWTFFFLLKCSFGLWSLEWLASSQKTRLSTGMCPFNFPLAAWVPTLKRLLDLLTKTLSIPSQFTRTRFFPCFMFFFPLHKLISDHFYLSNSNNRKRVERLNWMQDGSFVVSQTLSQMHWSFRMVFILILHLLCFAASIFLILHT